MNGGSVVITLRRDPLRGYTREEFLTALKNCLDGRVLECWTFGSFAQDTMSKFSDIDIILILETEIPFTARSAQFLDLLQLGPRLDLLIYNPVEFKKLLETPIGFWKSVRESMIRII